MKNYFVYILTNFRNTTFYIGVTNSIEKRILEHRKGLIRGFSQKYHLEKLVYYEECFTVNDAIAREKQLKNWHREWKINLIKQSNPEFKDLDAEMNSA